MIKAIRTRRNARRLARTLAPYTLTPAQRDAWTDYETERAAYAERIAARTGSVILAPRAYRIAGRI